VSKIFFDNLGSDPDAPAAGRRILFSKPDGFYMIDENNVVTPINSANVLVSETEPPNPTMGMLWVDTSA
jgi:hypothetical protein